MPTQTNFLPGSPLSNRNQYDIIKTLGDGLRLTYLEEIVEDTVFLPNQLMMQLKKLSDRELRQVSPFLTFKRDPLGIIEIQVARGLLGGGSCCKSKKAQQEEMIAKAHEMQAELDDLYKKSFNPEVFFMACCEGDSDESALDLIEARLNNDNSKVNYLFDDGVTPIMIAARFGHLKLLKLLIEKGANVDQTSDNGTTALICAVAGNHLECVRVLVENNANIFHASDDGTTPLLIAITNENTECIRLFELGDNANEFLRRSMKLFEKKMDEEVEAASTSEESKQSEEKPEELKPEQAVQEQEASGLNEVEAQEFDKYLQEISKGMQDGTINPFSVLLQLKDERKLEKVIQHFEITAPLVAAQLVQLKMVMQIIPSEALEGLLNGEVTMEQLMQQPILN